MRVCFIKRAKYQNRNPERYEEITSLHKASGASWEYILSTTRSQRKSMWAGAVAYHERQKALLNKG